MLLATAPNKIDGTDADLTLIPPARPVVERLAAIFPDTVVARLLKGLAQVIAIEESDVNSRTSISLNMGCFEPELIIDVRAQSIYGSGRDTFFPLHTERDYRIDGDGNVTTRKNRFDDWQPLLPLPASGTQT